MVSLLVAIVKSTKVHANVVLITISVPALSPQHSDNERGAEWWRETTILPASVPLAASCCPVCVCTSVCVCVQVCACVWRPTHWLVVCLTYRVEARGNDANIKTC